MAEDQLEVAASRALEKLSSSVHARSRPEETHPFIPTNTRNTQTDILELFMSPDKPKSRLRQLAENSAKKYSSTPNNTTPADFFLNLGTPSQPPIDPKTFVFKPPSRGSIRPRQPSLVPRKSLSHIKSPRSSIENLLDDLDILDQPKPTSSSKEKKSSLDSIRKPRPSRASREPPRDPPVTRKSRRVTVVHLSNHQTNLDTTHDSQENSSMLNSHSENIECDTSDQCGVFDPHTEDGDSTCSNDYFDPTVLLPQPETKKEKKVQAEIKQESDDDSISVHSKRPYKRNSSSLNSRRFIPKSDSDIDVGTRPSSSSSQPPPSSNRRVLAVVIPKVETKGKKERSTEATVKNQEEEDDDDSIIVQSKRPSRRNPSRLNSKRLVPDSDSETGDETQLSTSSSRPPRSSSSRTMANRPHQQKISVQANHSKLKSSDLNFIDVHDSSSDDSIEILPSRALQFQKNRALAISSNNLPGCSPLNELKTDEKKTMPQDGHNQIPSSSEEKIKTKTKKSAKSSSSDLLIAIDPPINSLVIKGPKTKTNVDEPPKPVVKKSTSTKKPVASKKKPVPFSKIRDELAEELIERLDAEVFDRRLPEELELVWSKRLNTTAGRAKWSIIKDPNGKVLREKVLIELATKVIDDEVKLRNTLAHELCHIACWFIDRQKDEKHGKYFKAWAKKINLVLPDITVTTKHDYVISYKFNWSCDRPECTKVYGRHSNSIDPERHGCVCGGRFVRIPKTTTKKATTVLDAPALSTTDNQKLVLSVDDDLTGRMKDLFVAEDVDLIQFSQDLIEL